MIHRISIVLAFSHARAKTVRIGYVWTHLSLKTEKKNVSFQNTVRKMDLHKVAPFKYVANI